MPPFLNVHPTLISVPNEVLTDRLRLRPVSTKDAQQMFEAIEESRSHLNPWLSWPRRMQTLADVEDLCLRSQSKWLLREDLMFGIFSIESGVFLGATGLHEPDWTVRSYEVGYWLRASAIGRGYAREAVKGLTFMARDDLKAHRIEIRCDPCNVRSCGVAEGLGFQLEGRLRNATVTPEGRPRDSMVFSVTDQDEWP